MAGLIDWPDSQKCLECKHGYVVDEPLNACACVKDGRCKFEPKEEEG